jgi:hypothetical protein
LGTNPKPAEKDGRFHEKGDFPLYFSTQHEAAIEEVKEAITKHIIVGEFKVCRLKTVFSLLPEDYSNTLFYPVDNPIHELCDFLSALSHQPEKYEETKRFVRIFRENGFITEKDFEDGLFVIRYKSLKYQNAANYFMCGANETSKLLGRCRNPRDNIGFPIPTDYGFLEFLGITR